MENDPFEEFRKKKLDVKKSTVDTDKYYDMPAEGRDGSVKGMVTHRFTPTEATTARPEGYERTELGDALNEPEPEVERPKGFQSTAVPPDSPPDE